MNNIESARLNLGTLLKPKTRLWLLIILLVGLGLRVFLPTSVTGSEGRSRWYRTALHLSDGRGYTLCWQDYFPFCGEDNEQTAISEPVPVLTYALLIKLFGDDSDGKAGYASSAIVILQTILGLGVTFLLYRIAIHLFNNPTVSLLGTFLWATYLPMVMVERDFLAESIFIFLLTAGMLFVLIGLKRDQLLPWGAAGLLLGLATMSRSALIYFYPF